MLMEVMRSLRDSGIAVEYHDMPADAHDQADEVLDVLADGRRARFALETKKRAPYPGELQRLQISRERLSKLGHPLLVVPFVSDALGANLRNAGWSWADAQGNFDLHAPGLWLRQRRSFTAPAAKKRTLPRGAGSFAVIRALIRFPRDETEHAGATALAEQVGVSQPRVSQVLHRLRDLELVDSIRHGRWKPRREALLDRFLAEYPGPGGSESYLYGLDAPADISVRASDAIAPRNLIAVSADVGPDLIVPWRRPSIVIFYAKRPLDPTSLGLVEAHGRHDANVIVRLPEDTSVFTTPPKFTAELDGREVELADPAQQIWDLQDLGGADRVDAAERLREWLLARP
jgi:DNA-binding transcriptional ArsR family regulator